jgi:tetratricopeptide (TPR) repeat protein
LLVPICSAEDAAIYYDKLGSKQYSAGNYTDALSYFNSSIDLNSSYADAWIHKGDALRALKGYNSSIDAYARAAKLDARKDAAWSGTADAYRAMKDYANASAAAAKATARSSKNKGYWLKEGQLLQMQGLFEESVPKFDGALALDPNYRDALYGKAFGNGPGQCSSIGLPIGRSAGC